MILIKSEGLLVVFFFFFFFFQAEDGIRDSVASRGLGDVYKRQLLVPPTWGGGMLRAPVGDIIKPPPHGVVPHR